MLQGPGHDLGERVGADLLRQRPVQIALLPATAPRRHDEPARERPGGLRAVVGADYVEAEVDSGGRPGGGEHIAVVHEQFARIDVHRRIALGQRRRVHPVGGGRPSVQQAGGREHEGPRAQSDDACALLVGAPQRVQSLGGRRRGDRPPGGHHHGAGPADRLQAVRRGEFETAGGAQRSLLAPADQQAVAGNSRVLPVDSENGERDGALEDRATAEQQHGNDFPASPPGQLACGLRRGGGVLAHDAKPPSVFASPWSLRASRSCTFPLGVARVPSPRFSRSKSTASRGPAVTPSPTSSMSIRGRGVKRSITKRSTREAHGEVLLAKVARPHRVKAYRAVRSCLVDGGVSGHPAKGRTPG